MKAPYTKDLPAEERTDPGLAARQYYAIDHLKNGQAVFVRALRPDDKKALQEGMHHLSRESRYYRFLSPKDELSDSELKYFTELDFVNHVGLAVGILEHGSEIPVGVGRYILESRSNKKPDCAELAFAVEETFQNQGVGTLLLKHLAVIARQSGLKYFSANVLGDNAKMCAVLAHSPLFVRVVNCGEGIRRFVLKLK